MLDGLDQLPGLQLARLQAYRLLCLVGQHRQDLPFRRPQKKRAVFSPNLENRISEKDGQQVREE
jgi:hypothetical protein